MKKYKSTLDFVTLVREKSDIKRAKLLCSNDSADYARDFFAEDLSIRESMYAIYTNQANNTIGYQLISAGAIAATIADCRIILKGAIDCLASGVILVHNHPSGSLRPSNADNEITSKIEKYLKEIDIRLIDHLIITEDSYFSYADNGKL